MLTDIFFSGWPSLIRVVVIGPSAYVLLVLLLRISGKRTLSKMNAFDLIVTVALGSILASTLLSKNVALADGLLALAVLAFLQYCVAWLSIRSKRFSRLVKASPRLLFFKGQFLTEAMRAERVTHNEVLAAIRTGSKAGLQEVGAVVLETDGSFSVLPAFEPAADPVSPSSLDSVNGVPASLVQRTDATTG